MFLGSGGYTLGGSIKAASLPASTSRSVPGAAGIRIFVVQRCSLSWSCEILGFSMNVNKRQ
jgi:hypothetical protein